MAGKKKRARPHRKAKYGGYLSSNTLFENKAKKIVKNIFTSGNPEATFAKIIKTVTADTKQYVQKLFTTKLQMRNG